MTANSYPLEMSRFLSFIGILALILLGLVALAVIPLGITLYQTETIAVAGDVNTVPSPSGKLKMVKKYHGDESIGRTISLEDETGHETVLKLTRDSRPYYMMYNDDGIMFAWQDEGHVIVAGPKGLPQIEGPATLGKVSVSYTSYEPDADKLSKPPLVRELQNPSVSFADEDYEQVTRVKWSNNEPTHKMTGRRCSVTVEGADEPNFTTVSFQIVGNGIGKSGQGGVIGRVRFNYTFTPSETGNPLIPTQAKPGKTEYALQDKGIVDDGLFFYRIVQTPNSVIYPDRESDEINKVFADLRKGKLVVKVGFNFDQSLIAYTVKTDPKAAEVAIQGFQKCAASTSLAYQAP